MVNPDRLARVLGCAFFWLLLLSFCLMWMTWRLMRQEARTMQVSVYAPVTVPPIPPPKLTVIYKGAEGLPTFQQGKEH